MKKVAEITSFLGKIVTELETVAEKRTAEAEKVSVKRKALAIAETEHLNEAVAATNASQGIKKLLGGGV